MKEFSQSWIVHLSLFDLVSSLCTMWKMAQKKYSIQCKKGNINIVTVHSVTAGAELPLEGSPSPPRSGYAWHLDVLIWGWLTPKEEPHSLLWPALLLLDRHLDHEWRSLISRRMGSMDCPRLRECAAGSSPGVPCHACYCGDSPLSWKAAVKLFGLPQTENRKASNVGEISPEGQVCVMTSVWFLHPRPQGEGFYQEWINIKRNRTDDGTFWPWSRRNWNWVVMNTSWPI